MLIENMKVLLLLLSVEHFAQFLQSASNMSVHHLLDNDDDKLLQSVLTGVINTFSADSTTDVTKKCLSAVTMKLLVDLCDIAQPKEVAVHLSGPMLEKLATCLSYCDPKQVTPLCAISKDSPVSRYLCMLERVHRLHCWLFDYCRCH